MKYIVSGSLGRVSRPLTETLVKAGHHVTVIASKEERKGQIQSIGADAAIGSLEDEAFLASVFSGADGIYTMIPPKFESTDRKEYIHSMGRILAAAIRSSGVKKVVNLSSIGAHLPMGAGLASGLCRAENELNQLTDVDIKHLRPGVFFYGLLVMIDLIKKAGYMGCNMGENTPLLLVHHNDIASIAAAELSDLSFTGKTVRYIAGDERTTSDIARVIGAAIGRPALTWVNFTDEQLYDSIIKIGIPHQVALNFTEMGAAIANGTLFEDFYKHKPEFSPTKLEDFTHEFVTEFEKN